MRMLKVELKRILKSRRAVILMLAGICLSALLAVAPISFVNADVYDDNGNVQELNGLSAIHYWREVKAPSNGKVTPGKLKAALETYQNCVEEYGSPDSEDFPVEVYIATILWRFILLQSHLLEICFACFPQHILSM